MQKQDRLKFNKIDLQNGYSLFMQESHLPVVYARIVVPVGNAHAHTDNQDCFEGCFHFLEHMCFESSVQFPNKNDYQNLLIKTGSSQNAWTDSITTDFNFEAPAETFHTAFPAFLDHLTSPLFNPDEIAVERDIIINERTERKYFPGFDELSQYEQIGWMNVLYYSRDQLFGSDESLDLITPEALKKLHRYYFSQPVQIFVVGTFDTEKLVEQLAVLPPVVQQAWLTTKRNVPTWQNRNFHEFACADIDMYIYHLGGVFTDFSIENAWVIDFMLELLSHEEHGSLQNWIRKEKGWSYSIEHSLIFDTDRMVWTIKVPVSEREVVDQIRTELTDRIKVTIADENFIEATKNRLLLRTNFDLETLSSRLNAAILTHSLTGRIITESEYRAWLQDTVTPAYIETAYTKYFHSDVTGEFLAVPKS